MYTKTTHSKRLKSPLNWNISKAGSNKSVFLTKTPSDSHAAKLATAPGDTWAGDTWGGEGKVLSDRSL